MTRVYFSARRAFRHAAFEEIVTTMSSPAAKVLLLDRDVTTSDEETACAAPPIALEFTLNVAVAVPLSAWLVV